MHGIAGKPVRIADRMPGIAGKPGGKRQQNMQNRHQNMQKRHKNA